MLKIVSARDYDDMSRKAANIISAQVILKPDTVLGLATGSTPIGAYHQLIDWYKKGDVDFSQVRTYNLDEYRGLSHDDPQSYHYFMRDNFFDHINIDLNNTHVPDGANPDAEAACAEYDKMVADAATPIFSFLELATTAISASTSPMTTSPRARIASTSPSPRSRRTAASSSVRRTCRVRHTPWACRPSCMPA